MVRSTPFGNLKMEMREILATTQFVAGEYSTAQVFKERYFVAQNHNQH